MRYFLKRIKKIEKNKQRIAAYYDKYKNLVYCIMKEYKLDPIVAEDIALNLFCRIPSLAKKYDSSKGKFTTYLCTVIRNTIIKALNEKDSYIEHRTLRYDIEEMVDEKTLPKPYNFTMSTVKSLLTEQEYDLIFNVYVTNQTLKEYAAEKKLGYSTIKMHHTLIIEKLRRLTEDFFKP